MGRSGLYAEVKAALREIRSTLPSTESASRSALQMASPHWLRHSYAHTLVVQQGVPLPVVQMLLGHASVQTAASYATTDIPVQAIAPNIASGSLLRCGEQQTRESGKRHLECATVGQFDPQGAVTETDFLC